MSKHAKPVRVRVSFEYVIDEASGDTPFNARFDREFIKDKLDRRMALAYKRLRVERVSGEQKS